MESSLLLLRALVCLFVGGVLGLGFAAIQAAALRRQEQHLANGRPASGWVVMPGSAGRVTLLLLVLVLVQVFCPMLFADGAQWWVSGGVVLGYGGVQLRQVLRLRKASRS